jgi:membrane AbrB-like protein
LDIATALISCVPGGLPAMVSMAEEVEADATVVAAIHFFRLLVVLVVVPAVVGFLLSGSGSPVVPAPVEGVAGPLLTLFVLMVGLISSLVAVRLDVPAGDLVAPIIVIGGANLLGAGLGPLHDGLMDVAMVLIGTAAGAQMTRESLRRLRQIALPATAVVIVLITIGLSAGWSLSRIASLDLITGLMSGAPGGASTMPAVAYDMGGDMRLVAAVHIVRMVVAFACLPFLIRFLLKRLNGRAGAEGG